LCEIITGFVNQSLKRKVGEIPISTFGYSFNVDNESTVEKNCFQQNSWFKRCMGRKDKKRRKYLNKKDIKYVKEKKMMLVLL
jgi:hypothetical protein